MFIIIGVTNMSKNNKVLFMKYVQLINLFKYHDGMSLSDFQLKFDAQMLNLELDDYSVLQEIIIFCGSDILEYVLSFPGININFQSSLTGMTVFNIVSQKNVFTLEKAKLLIKYDFSNIDSSLLDVYGNNPIHDALHSKAVSWKNPKIVADYYDWIEMLHDAGFILMKKDYAIVDRYDDFKILNIFDNMLPKYEVNTSQAFQKLIEAYKNNDQKSLDYFKNNFEENMLDMNYYGFSLIQLVVKYCSPDIVRYVLRYGKNIDINYQHPVFRTTVLQIVTMRKVFDYKLAHDLLSYADVDTSLVDIFGENPVDTAVREKPRSFQKSELEEDYYNWLQDLYNAGFRRTKSFEEITNRFKDYRSQKIFEK